jgi:hypothetical protein
MLVALLIRLVIPNAKRNTNPAAEKTSNSTSSSKPAVEGTDTFNLGNVCPFQEEIKYYYYDEKESSWEPNNKFGLYIYAENKTFFEKAKELVNSKGGDWGYVLIPYNVSDYDNEKWERVFEQLRSKHLIPVIQLWGIKIDDYKKQTEEAAAFLNRFPWPIRYRYISVYNEPNDSKFWQGRTNPEEYAQVLSYTFRKFKEENVEFFIMNGALNVTAPSDGQHIDAFDFMWRMNKAEPGIFEKLDGWASHPYPQPNFAGNPRDRGRWSIRAYEDELNYLKNSLGVSKELPVFITETGWAHAEGKNYNSGFLSVSQVAKNIKIAYEDVWLKDPRVRAVMPFTVAYDAPFDHFSWVNEDYVPYEHFDEVKKIRKITGQPPIIQEASMVIERCNP